MEPSSTQEKETRRNLLRQTLSQVEQTQEQERVKLYKDVVNFQDSQVKQVLFSF
jgi:hypothetical protein